MSTIISVDAFEDWRQSCRGLLQAEVPPSEVLFVDRSEATLFQSNAVPVQVHASVPSVPQAFVAFAARVAHHRDRARWTHLYRVLWRLTHGEPHLLDLATDADVHWLLGAEKSVRRDAHKMKAFVRFRKVGDHFVAWHRPDHRIVRLVAPFFQRRFPEMHWTILTPDESVTWDCHKLQFGPGVPRRESPDPDALEELWKSYYRTTFNPARIKLRMMKRELPVRHWRTLPETQIIADMLAEAPDRVASMVSHAEGVERTAASFLPAVRTLDTLRDAAKGCTACVLCRHATQTVFGEGPADAKIMLVGEQPGDQEDVAGRPFIGPAGGILDEAICLAELRREDLYLTNAVKHFKFKWHDSHRQHHRADVHEMNACQPWLAAELEVLKPEVVVCLGATAARAVLGPLFRFNERRGEVVETDRARAIATFHPSAALRAASPAHAAKIREDLMKHLKMARDLAL